MDPAIAERFGLGPITQVSYVVADMDVALQQYGALFGAFDVFDSALPECTIRGKTADCRLKVAINKSGPIEIALIEVVEGETTPSEHLSAHGEGLHHVRFEVDDIDAKLGELQAAGFETVFYKRLAPTIAFAYLEAPKSMGSSVIELLDMP